MVKLNEEELRKEYILNIKSDRLYFGLMGFLILGSAIYLILSSVDGVGKLLVVIPTILIIFYIKRLRMINKQIKDNQEE